ncbi:MAG: prepilin-type N-terminal cleavage/methylation domain-containing protein [Verrucomicrobia bacterium]|nr:prepilin-type N-terminal cleavage/methylation domain-containing protein [Verrucomicrobiota bacterium]
MKKSQKNAFTLIEIMVATAVMVVLVGLVIQITSQVLNVWNRSSGKLAANAQARIAMDLLTQDLETAVFRNNGMMWLEATQEDLDNPFTISGYKTTTLKLFAPALDRPEGPGDICAIGYLLAYRNPIDGTASGEDQTFVLYRNVVSPEDTFNNLMGDPNQLTLDGGKWSEPNIIGSGAGSEGGNFLVSSIVDFQITFYAADDGDPNTSEEIPPGSLIRFGGASPTVGVGAPGNFNRPLAYADIMLRVLTDEALAVINRGATAYEAAGYDDWPEYIAANSEVFTRRVNFLARPL